MTVKVKAAANLPTLTEDQVGNLYADEHGRLHVVLSSGAPGSGASLQDLLDALEVIQTNTPAIGQQVAAASRSVTPASDSDPFPTSEVAGTALHGGAFTATSVAAALGGATNYKPIIVQCLDDSAATLYVGPSGLTASNGFRVLAGQAYNTGCGNLAAIFVVTSSASASGRWSASS